MAYTPQNIPTPALPTHNLETAASVLAEFDIHNKPLDQHCQADLEAFLAQNVCMTDTAWHEYAAQLDQVHLWWTLISMVMLVVTLILTILLYNQWSLRRRYYVMLKARNIYPHAPEEQSLNSLSSSALSSSSSDEDSY